MDLDLVVPPSKFCNCELKGNVSAALEGQSVTIMMDRREIRVIFVCETHV